MTAATRRTRLVSLAGSAALALTTAVVGAPVQADPDPTDPWEVVAEGLDNPRQLSIKAGKLYVAEAGVGGEGPCIPGPEGEDVCFGKSGAVTQVSDRGQLQVLTRLPSLAAPDGSAALGPADVLVLDRKKYAVTIGLGADPAVREQLPPRGRRLMGTIVTGIFGHGAPRVLADLAAFETATDLDGLGPDSNPTGMLRGPRGIVVTDSGANTLLRVGDHGRLKPLAVFDSPGTATAPFPPFPEIEVQPVPTSVAIGPDGAYYVSELTGFPFVPGLARIHRVVPGEEPTVYATGLTNVTDLAWHGDDLYAVQIADAGLAAGGLPMGSLVRVVPGGESETVAGPFPAPYGLAIHEGSAYVTTCAVCPDAGTVVKVPLES